MREVVHNEGVDEERNWSDLPHDLLCKLLYHLSPPARCAFKATCKSWSAAKISLPPPIDSPVSPCYYSCPNLMFTNCYKSRYKFYNPINHEFFLVCATGLKGALVRCSNFGWLLMSRPNLDLFFYNPVTTQKVLLPRSDIAFTAMCFSSPPTSLECQVFGIANDDCIGIIRRGEKTWRIHAVKGLFAMSTHNPVFYNGAYYCLDRKNGDIGVCCPDESAVHKIFKIRQTHLFKTERKGRRQIIKAIRQSFLLEDDGKLYGIFNRHDDGITVQCLNLKSWRWQPVLDFPNKSLFVSHSASFVFPTTKHVANRVYFPKFHDEVGIFYSLNTMKYHSVAGSFSSKTSYELEEIMEFGTWIKPNFNRVPEAELNR
ncbi:OLC1v1000411C1 [Oldenlandia corymbosa var. corymbosa]|uniref:OLC1v1000411C1 n=1 Tax=Oldenlandia corymbosa var. corymbosa TaxID=529605 RepID=A0AAV1D378_OLDCO|nr:OLC1v1000411C1 [Oldenlandia corymbosa var. corymbosa]